MNVTEIVSVAAATLLVLVLAHLAVYWVVKTLYPPTAPAVGQAAVPAPVVLSVAEPPKAVTFTEPPSTLQQDVTLPTYEAPVPDAASREAGERRGPPPAESTSIRRDPGVVAPNA